MDARLGRTGTGARPRVRGWGEAAARGCGGERASPIRTTPRIRVESAIEPRILGPGIVGPARPCRPALWVHNESAGCAGASKSH